MKIPESLFLLCLATAPAFADQLATDQGDRLSGELLRLEGDKVYFKTAYGTVEVPFSSVSQLRTETPRRVTLREGGRLTGRLEMSDGELRFVDAPDLAGLSLPASAVLAMGPADAPLVKLEGQFNVGATVTQGNTETELYHVDAELIARGRPNRYSLYADANYGEEDGERIVSDATLQAGYDHFVGDRWYFNSTVGLTRDEFRDLRLRTTAGVGMGYQFRDDEIARLAAEAGLSYIHEDFEEADDESQPAGRWALDYRRRLGGDGPTFFHRHELLVGLDDPDDTLLRSQTGLRFPLLERLAGTVEVDYDYDWQPPAGAESEDVTYMLKLGYSL